MNSSTFSPLGRPLAAGVVALALLAGRAQGQYVSTAISNQLNEPYGVAIDPANNLYIADTVNNRIALYVPGTTNVSNVAGGDSPTSLGTNDGSGSAALFNQPVGIVYAPARGAFAVVDQNNQEIRLVTTGGVVTTLAGVAGHYGLVDGTNLAQVQFSFPAGIAVGADGGTLYIADAGNNAIRMLSYPSNVLSTIATNFIYNSATHPFFSPSAVAVDNMSNIWVADSQDDVICVISNGSARGVAGKYRVTGTNDSLTASNASFNLPSGLVWDGSKNILVISDTRNDTIRKLYLTNGNYAVGTVAGVAGQRGFVDGPLGTAKFSWQTGICIDPTDTGYYVADTINNAVRVVQPTLPPPPPVQVPDPVIGYVTYPLVNGAAGAQFNPITAQISVFNNIVPLTIEQLDGTVQTYLSYGPTGSNIPPPGPNTQHVTPYTSADDGMAPGQVPVLNLSIAPALTLETISEAPGRPSSDAVSAQIQFVTANPNIVGQNAEAVTLTDATTNAQIYYTLDGSIPVPGATNTFPASSTQGLASGSIISFRPTTNTTLTVRAFTANFTPSGIVTSTFTAENFATDDLTFGFASGEGSSVFVAAAGQRFYAPVTLTLIPSALAIDSLQFNIALTNLTTNGSTAPPVGAAFTFQSMLEKPLPNVTPAVYVPIPPEMFTSGGFSNLLFTNSGYSLLGVGWLERLGETNLYDTTAQTLITFSQAHDTLFKSDGQQVIVGGYSFDVPSSAQIGQQYEIQLGSPSATSDGISQNVTILAVTNGSLTNGAINSTKIVTVGSVPYLVGDVSSFRWFNAGDFGDGTLLNNDVTETFQSAIYLLNRPPPGSDFFDAMDSSDGTDSTVYQGNDSAINSITHGDGVLAVDDVYVTYRRSLDPSLNWVERYWTNGARTSVIVSNQLAKPFTGGAPAGGFAGAGSVSNAPSGFRYITVAADQIKAGGNLSVQVPCRVLAADTLPIRVLMLHITVTPLDGSPPLTSPITFNGVTNLGTNWASYYQTASDYGEVWLNSDVPGVAGASVLGALSVNLPSNVTSNSAYLVHFDHFSASPNGLALFHSTIQDGLITVGDRSGSSWKDGISDAWRLVNFGSVSNSLSAAAADPDGDGASNWAEYVAGTNPNDATSAFKFSPVPSMAPSTFTLQWPSVVNKTYTLQCCYDFAHGKWATVATNIQGNGQMMQWTDTNATGQAQYYRALVQ